VATNDDANHGDEAENQFYDADPGEDSDNVSDVDAEVVSVIGVSSTGAASSSSSAVAFCSGGASSSSAIPAPPPPPPAEGAVAVGRKRRQVVERFSIGIHHIRWDADQGVFGAHCGNPLHTASGDCKMDRSAKKDPLGHLLAWLHMEHLTTLEEHRCAKLD
jgi:hypothetical protein